MELTVNRLLYLLYLKRSDKINCTVTKMANLFQVSKATVSRNMDYFADQGVVYEDSMRLTDYGNRLAQQYGEEVELLESWIEWTSPCGSETNRDNALKMTVHMSEDMKAQIFQKVRLNQMFQHLNHRGEIAFSEFVEDLQDGNYKIPFLIYRAEMEAGKYYSMANRGFEHPGILRISGKRGMVSLKATTMEGRNMIDHLVLVGKLMKLEYSYKGSYVPAEKDGDSYYIPAEAFDYTFHKDEDLIVGNLMVQTYAPMAKKKLHTKEAMLSIIIKAL